MNKLANQVGNRIIKKFIANYWKRTIIFNKTKQTQATTFLRMSSGFKNTDKIIEFHLF